MSDSHQADDDDATLDDRPHRRDRTEGNRESRHGSQSPQRHDPVPSSPHLLEFTPFQEPPSQDGPILNGSRLRRRATTVHTVHLTECPQDFTVHLRLPVRKDFSSRLDKFSQFIRLGNFCEAEIYFSEQLEDDIDHPYVFVHYAAMLLKKGDYKSFDQLDSGPVFADFDERSFIRRPKREHKHSGDDDERTSVHDENRGNDESDSDAVRPLRDHNSRSTPYRFGALDLLHCEWRLMKALSTYHLHGTLNEAMNEVENTTREVSLDPEMCSTEIHVVVLTFEICALLKSSAEAEQYHNMRNATAFWFNKATLTLYDYLLARGRVWDFADVFKALCTIFGPRETLARFAQGRDLDAVMEQWTLDVFDESTSLAQLDMLSWALSHCLDDLNGTTELRKVFSMAEGYADCIKTNHPKRMKSTPFIRWLLARTVYASLDEKWFNDHVRTLVSQLSESGGLLVGQDKSPERIYYIPRGSEIPGRPVPRTPADANRPVIVALEAAKQLRDYETQAYGLRVFISRSINPTDCIEELLELEKNTQGDENNYLLTLLTTYPTCLKAENQRQLLERLAHIPKWTNPGEIRAHRLYFARDFIHRALTIRLGLDRPLNLQYVEMPYKQSLQLEPRFRRFAVQHSDQ